MKKILFVDDDISLLRIYHQRLSSEGYEVINAFTGDGVLSLLKNQNPDLIVLDIMLPGSVSGMDILEVIKKDPTYNKIPIIILSNLDTHVVKALEIGAIWYFVKANTSMEEVVKKIKSVTG